MKYISWCGILFLCACQSNTSTTIEDIPGAGINCSASPKNIAWELLLSTNCNRLSDYGLFVDSVNPLKAPRNPGLKYFLGTELFTDYAHKYRFMFIPDNTEVEFSENSVFDFPVGTTLVKTFVLPGSNDKETATDIVETRLLIRREQGWVGMPFVWNEEKTEAILVLTGRSIEKSVVVDGVGQVFNYQVPNVGDCRTCHIVRNDDESITAPIGLKSRHLNRNISLDAREVSQLLYWQEKGILIDLPVDLHLLPSVPRWGDTSRSLQDRAKGYLDINCSHCHTPGGSGAESGMYLEYWRAAEFFDHGVCKRPGGFNGGSKELVFDLVPGDAEESLIPYRMSLLASEGSEKGQMPPIARHLNHVEGIQLVRSWIDSMDSQPCN